jgi:hypothetical protein
MAVAPVGVVVPQRMVLRAAVVPKRNRVWCPLKAHAQLGRLNVPIEHLQNRVAFALVQTDNMRGEEAIHEQAFPTCLGMRPNNRMLGTRIIESRETRSPAWPPAARAPRAATRRPRRRAA